MTILSVTDVVEHAFCPKFTYYTSVLGLKQYEEKRGTVSAGRNLHQRHEKINKSYLPRNLKGHKIISHRFYSQRLNLVGKIDEAIETADEFILIERKYTDNTRIGKTLKVQLGLLSILIEENTNKPVKRAIVIFSKNTRITKIVQIDDSIKKLALEMLDRTKGIILKGVLPFSRFDNRCLNCCFRKICPTGSLNIDK